MTNASLSNESSRPADDAPLVLEHATAPLAENIFLDDAETAPVVARTRQTLPTEIVPSCPALPGPGLPEAVLWVIGCFVAHIVGSVAMLLLLVVVTIFSTGEMPDQVEIEEVIKSNMLTVTGGEQLVFVLFAMAAIFVRFGRNRASQLGLRLPRVGHALLVVALTFPVAFVSGHCFHVATEAWQSGLKRMDDVMASPSLAAFGVANLLASDDQSSPAAPGSRAAALVVANQSASDESRPSLSRTQPGDSLSPAISDEGLFWRLARRLWRPIREFIRGLDDHRTMDVLKDLSSAPLPLLLLIIAVAPALGEELMFRGLIGRGLVARWGVVRGVLLTSLLFGIVHIHPAHALGVIPLGIAMHFVYLTTRSFWAPVLLHFLNNAWATTVTKYSAELEGTDLMADNVGLPPQVLIQSLVVTVAIAMLLWHTRVRYVLPTGEHWSPSYATAETPPSHALAEPTVSPPTRLLLLHGVGSLFALGVILWQSA